MTKTFKDLTLITIFTLALTLAVWLPHLLSLSNFWGLSFKEGFPIIYRNFDGLEYIIIAKTFYNPNLISSLPQSLPANYFASHFPLYSIFIFFFAPLLGYLKSMLFVSVVSTILAVWVFYLLVRDFKLTNNPVFLSLIFTILPARWLIVHSVGSSEPTFILFILCAFYFFMKFEQSGRLLDLSFASLAGFFAQFTRPPGILLFIALVVYLTWKFFTKRNINLRSIFKFIPLLLIPLGLLLIFFWYLISYQDFFAYFHSGDNIHLTFPPFQVFNRNQFWVGDIWLEDVIYTFTLGFLGTVLLWKGKFYSAAFFVLTYLLASIFVAHRDISRYVLPIFPFILIAFEKILTSKEFRIILPILALAIYLYAQNFILANTSPIPNLDLYN